MYINSIVAKFSLNNVGSVMRLCAIQFQPLSFIIEHFTIINIYTEKHMHFLPFWTT